MFKKQETKDFRIAIRVTKSEYNFLRTEADKLNIKISQYIQDCIYCVSKLDESDLMILRSLISF